MQSYVIISREGSRFIDAPDWKPVVFASMRAAKQRKAEILRDELICSRDLPLRIVSVDSASISS